MKTGWSRMMGWGVAFAAIGTLATTSGASAQGNNGDCRCVDADGNAIDNCTCFVTPTPPTPPQVLGFLPNGRFGLPPEARPRLGVTVSTGQDDALDTQGARVTDVMEDGPADDAGIREGDIITSVDGHSLLAPLDSDVEEDFELDESIPVQRLLAIAQDLDPGESIEITYLRDGESRTATVEVQDLAGIWGTWARDFTAQLRPQMDQLRTQLQDQYQSLGRTRAEVRTLNGGLPFVVGSLSRFGLQIMELTPGLEEYFGVEQGVLVTDVDEDSSLGLQPGDVILRIGDRDATTPDRVRRILGSYGDDESVTFRVSRRGSEVDVMGRLAS